MNRKQRTKNRGTAARLHLLCLPRHVCPNCGETVTFSHWFSGGHDIEAGWMCLSSGALSLLEEQLCIETEIT